MALARNVKIMKVHKMDVHVVKIIAVQPKFSRKMALVKIVKISTQKLVRRNVKNQDAKMVRYC